MADWSLLPKELLELIINGRLKTCFEIAHFRSVCSSWRSVVPPPSYMLRLGVNTILPIFSDNPRFEGDKHCTLKKIPAFLFRYQTPFGADSLIVGISESTSEKQKLMSSLPGFGFTSEYGKILNTLSSQILPLGHNYVVDFHATRRIGYRTIRQRYSKKVAFLPMDSEDGKEFTVVAGVLDDLMMYRSRHKRWIKLHGRFVSYRDMVSFKGKFYVVDKSGRGHVLVIEPSSLEVSEIHSVTKCHESIDERLVVSGDELLLVQRLTPGEYFDEYMYTWFRLFRLEERGKRRWVRVNDLEDRVVFLGIEWNLCYSAKEIPGVEGNCVMFIQPDIVRERVLVFDLGTRRTSKASKEYRGMGVFGENKESLVSCGIVTASNPAINIYDSSSSVP